MIVITISIILILLFNVNHIFTHRPYLSGLGHEEMDSPVVLRDFRDEFVDEFVDKLVNEFVDESVDEFMSLYLRTRGDIPRRSRTDLTLVLTSGDCSRFSYRHDEQGQVCLVGADLL